MQEHRMPERTRFIHVMVGVILDTRGRVLVTKRPGHVHQGGLWEFPGGKLEAGEPHAQGLARELEEELGIQVQDSRPLLEIRHDYGDRAVLLDVRRVGRYGGQPQGREGQPLAWRDPIQLDPADFPPANRPIINALRLPDRLLITPADCAHAADGLERLARALDGGIRLVQLRAHDLDDSAYAQLAERAFRLCEQRAARLILNRDPRRIPTVPRHGIHLTAHRLSDLDARPGQPGDWVGASCHAAAPLAQAARLGLDYALLSPVKPTMTHPEARPLGWSGFAALARPASLPVYALGGLGPADLDTALAHGAQGIAAIRTLWPGASDRQGSKE